MPGATLGALNVLVGADISDFSKGFDEVNKRLKKASRRMKSVGETMTRSLTLPIAAVGIAATKLAVDFESSFAGIRKTMDLTEAEFAKLAQANRDLAKEIPLSVNELNRIGELAGQLGIRGVDNVVKFERTVAQLAATTDLTADQAALSFAQITNVLQLPQDQIDRLGAAVVGLGNNFATVESQIVEFTTRIAGAGKVVNLTAGDVTGIATAFASLGIRAEAGGTAVQKVLLTMQQAVVQGGTELEAFAATAGVSAQAFRELFRADAGQAFVRFIEGLGEQGDQAINTLEELALSDQRLTRAFLAAAGAGDLLSRAVAQGNREFEANTALVQEAAKRFGTTESQMKLFLSTVKDIGITLGGALIPALTSALEAAKPIIEAVAGMAEAFAKADPVIQKIAIGIAAALGAGGPILIALGALTAAFAAISWPVVLGVAAVAGAIAAYAAFRDELTAVNDAIGGFVDKAITSVIEFVKTVKQWLGDRLGAIFGGVRSAVETVTGAFEWMKDQVVGNSFVPEMIEGIHLQFLRLNDVMVEPTMEATAKVGEAFDRLGASSISRLGDAIADFATGSADAFKNFVDSAIRDLTRLLVKMAIFKTIGLIPGVGSFLQTFGGFFARGGTLQPGQFGVVGERGPEMVFAGAAGASVQPMDELTVRFDTSNIPPPPVLSPEASAVDDYWRRLFSAAVVDARDRGVRFA